MDFWDVFWLLLIFIPLLLIWAFAIVDIFRRDDLSGWLKALWIVVVILLPFLGTLIYLIFRQPGATAQERRAMDQASREFVEKYSPNDSAQQLKLLSDLHDRGKLSDAEFAEEKTRVLDAARAHDTPEEKARMLDVARPHDTPPAGPGTPPAAPADTAGPVAPPPTTGGSEPPRRPRGFGA
ncbi:SHOCT domain-containing protein [Catellatospora vulcania]|uniref:SHOCT domain-containing protein n=1 Tax=Catellatospora vulcania TaxID=1460450 RepID=UPI0018AFD684|nr:SHOCT domain-containing protein [Catellatospora vulcania]